MKTTTKLISLELIGVLACVTLSPKLAHAAKPTPTPTPVPTATWQLNGTSAYYNAGNVGIGTSSPSNALSVVGSSDFSTSVFSPTFAALPGSGNSVSLRANDTTDATNAGSVNIAAGNSLSAFAGGTVSVAAGAYGGLSGARMDLRSYTLGGDVLLSTTSRGTLGGSSIDVRPPYDNLTCGSVVLTGGTSGSATGGPIILNAGDGGGDPFYTGGNITLNAGAGSGGSANGMIQLKIGGGERVRIDPAGNVGIGTTTPGATLDVNGNVAVAGTAVIAGVPATAVAGQPVYVDANGQLGVQVSSERFKSAIKEMGSGSEAILALKPVTFVYETDAGATPQFGLIAEQVGKINPDLVVRDRNGEIYAVRYDAVNAMLLNEFLKAHERLQRQEKRIDSLEAKLKEQEKLIQAVNDKLELSKPTPQLAVTGDGTGR